MTQEIEFSIMGESADRIQPLLDQFEAEHQIHVRLRFLKWDTAWSDLVKAALYRDNLDVSEVGSTGLGDLIATEALHPFSSQEISLLDGEKVFLPEAWRGGARATDSQQFGIPWLVGTRLLYYRRKLLARSGINERPAFQSVSQLAETLKRLQASGVKIPWIVPTGPVVQTVLNIVGWIWEAGGDFVTLDGKRTLFGEPAARAGIRSYFALGRYLTPEAQNLDDAQAHELFLCNPEAAVTLGTTQLFLAARERNLSELNDQLAVAPFPGPSYLGGSYLIIWKHTPQVEAALKLVRFLTHPSTQVRYSQSLGLVPVRMEALTHPAFTNDLVWRTAIQAVRQSRSLPAMRSWGIIGSKLTAAFGELWTEVLAQPDLNLEAAIQRRLELFPTGTVTFLFTDIEGSTQLWEQYPEAMKVALVRHNALLRQAIEFNNGYVFNTGGDAFCAAFASAPDALSAALAAQRALHVEAWGETPIRVRMALHTGVADEREGDYFGPPLNRVARLLSAGHGRQTLLSTSTSELVRAYLPPGAELRDMGERQLKDLARPEHIYQLLVPDLPAEFPPLKTLEDFRPNRPAQLSNSASS